MGITDTPLFYAGWALNWFLLLCTVICMSTLWFRAQHNSYDDFPIGVYVSGTQMNICTALGNSDDGGYCRTYMWADVDCEDDEWYEDKLLTKSLCNEMKHSVSSSFTFSIIAFFLTAYNAWLVSNRFHPASETDSAQNANPGFAAAACLSLLIAVCAFLGFPTDNIITDFVPAVTDFVNEDGVDVVYCPGAGFDRRQYWESAYDKLDGPAHLFGIIGIFVSFALIFIFYFGGKTLNTYKSGQKGASA